MQHFCFMNILDMLELSKLEVYFYCSVWASGVFVSLYRIFLVGEVFDHSYHDQYHYEDFKKGWFFLGCRFQDQADSEWNIWTKLAAKLIPFLAINLLGAEIIRACKSNFILPVWYAGVTFCFLIRHFKVVLMLWLITQTLIYYIIIYLNSCALIWLFSFALIYILKPEVWFVETEDDQYLIMISTSWLVLRSVSYSVDNIKKSNTKTNCGKSYLLEMFEFIGYLFYLPTMFYGPFISYSTFSEGLKLKFQCWTFNKALKTSKNFLKCLFWYFFTLFALHFIYVNAILLRPDLVSHLLDWELAGLGIAMGHFFHLKYIVFYGLPCAWADAEGYVTPKLPCCVSRVHLYSYMWRHFDQGLYNFLIKYIYIPVISLLKGAEIFRKIFASIICFTFIFIWHGGHDYVFFWAFFNYIAVTIEILARQISILPSVQHFLNKNLSLQNQIRLQCFLCAPLHCFSMISNYFFIGNGVEIGFIYLNRIYYASLKTKITILIFLYGAGQSAIASQKWESELTYE